MVARGDRRSALDHAVDPQLTERASRSSAAGPQPVRSSDARDDEACIRARIRGRIAGRNIRTNTLRSLLQRDLCVSRGYVLIILLPPTFRTLLCGLENILKTPIMDDLPAKDGYRSHRILDFARMGRSQVAPHGTAVRLHPRPLAATSAFAHAIWALRRVAPQTSTTPPSTNDDL